MISAVILIKLAINACVAIALYFQGKHDMALMFVGFAIADGGAAWVAFR